MKKIQHAYPFRIRRAWEELGGRAVGEDREGMVFCRVFQEGLSKELMFGRGPEGVGE